MRRARVRKSDAGVSLFPFLAVLICMMGALIVLLVLVVQQARVQADSIDEQREDERERQQQELRQLAEQEEDYLWRQEILEQQRRELTARISEGRLKLSHLEDHIRRLERRWEQLRREAAELRDAHTPRAEALAASQEEAARLQAQIEAAREELEALREAAARREGAYAIIPYDGPHGTRRRPIYVECTETAIIIHPEQVVLTPEDFAGPLGPGNPLDAALRAVREYWARAEGSSARGEPYPLLIVRPDGAVAYSLARTAMANWEDEFGYELVDAAIELDFPDPDPHLKKVLQDAVRTARERQTLLAAAMPSRFGMQPPSGFRLAEADLEPTPGRSWSADSRGRAARPGSSAAGRPPEGSPPAGGPGQPPPNPARHAQAPAGGGAEGPGGEGSRDPVADRDRTAEETLGYESAGEPGEHSPGGEFASGAPGGDGTGNAVHGRPGGGMQSIAAEQGANWALPRKPPRATGITRPLAIECHADRLIILPESDPGRPPEVYRLQGPMRPVIEDFVDGVHQRVERWGMAVAGGYWKPVLRVSVAPDAEDRFYELSVLLHNSGFDVQRR